MKLPIVDIDNPPMTFGKLTPEEKKRGAKAIEFSIVKPKLLSQKQQHEKTIHHNKP